MRLLLLIASALVASSAFAQTPGSCETGTAQRFLDISNVQASLFNTGGLFFGGSTTSGDGYLVPKFTGNSPFFAAGIWLSGTVNEDIRVSAARYGSYLFRPGPLNEDGSLPNAADCSAYDRIYVVSILDIQSYEGGQSPARDLAEWPVGLGAPTVDANGDPVTVTSREQVIDLVAGERPDLYGSQMAFWVMNDVGAPREDRNTAPLGVEVQVTAFVTASREDLPGSRESSFYRFTVINRNTETIENARFSFFTDPDLGDASDDYVGVDTTRGMAFTYNDQNLDAAYGSPPPAAGYDLLSHELVATSTFFGGGPNGTQDPGIAQEYYNYMQGLWGNGTPYYELNNGFEQTGAPTTPFFYAGDPVNESFWSEVNTDGNGADSPQGDRRYVATVALGTLAPGDTATVDMAILFAQGSDHLDSITELRAVSDGVQSAYDTGTLFQTGGPAEVLPTPNLIAPEEGSDLARADSVTFTWTPVEGASEYAFRWSTNADEPSSSLQLLDGTTASFAVRDLVRDAGVHTIYWTVAGLSPSAIGSESETRSLTVFRGGALYLGGNPAYMEATGPGGSDPCRVGASSTAGCQEFGENRVYNSFNSTQSYYVSDAKQEPGSDASLGAYAPHDFEIRFTDTGSLAAYADQDATVISVPFEVWDIGPMTPGEANDPSDDRQLIPLLFADNNGTCAFDTAEIPDGEATFGGFVESDRVYAHYPATTYTAFDAAFRARVDAAPEMCYTSDPQTIQSFLYPTDLAPPIQNLVFGSRETEPTLPAAGTVIRLYTVDPPFEAPFPIADEEPLQLGTLALATAYPNPATSSFTVPYTLATAGKVELVVVDVLGREVAPLVNALQPEGAHTARLDASALAPGVYVIRLRAGDDTRTTRITIVR